jgi:hypothetical protein
VFVKEWRACPIVVMVVNLEVISFGVAWCRFVMLAVDVEILCRLQGSSMAEVSGESSGGSHTVR